MTLNLSTERLKSSIQTVILHVCIEKCEKRLYHVYFIALA